MGTIWKHGGSMIPGIVSGSIHKVTAWTPADISTELWLDAMDASTIDVDGSNYVTQWRDKSGNGNHMTQGTQAQQATYAIDTDHDTVNKAVIHSINSRIGTTASMTTDAVIVVYAYVDGVDSLFDTYNTIFHNGTTASTKDRKIGTSGTANYHSSVDTLTDQSYIDGNTTSTNQALPMGKSIHRFAYTSITGTMDILFRSLDPRGWQGPVYEYILPAAGTSAADMEKLEGYSS